MAVKALTSPARLIAAALALLAGLLYLNTLHNPFVFDDLTVIVENRTLDRLVDLRAILTYNITRPLVNVSYALDSAIGGKTPVTFHVTNVLLHALNVVLFLIVARHLASDRAARRDRLGAGPMNPDVMAIGAAVLLAIHPMMTEAVGYISGRSELLCGTFVLLAFLAARRWMLDGGRWWWGLTLLSWVVALAAKEVAAVFPFVLLAYDRLILVDGNRVRRRRLLFLHAPLFTLLLLLAFGRLAVLALFEFPDELALHGQLALIQLDVLRRYLFMLIVPHDQAIFHAASPITSVVDIRVLFVPALLVLVAVAQWRRALDPTIVFGLFTFVLFLLPSSLLYVLGLGEVMTEHRVYVASTGLFLACGACIGWLSAQLHLVGPRVRWLTWAVLGLMAVQLSLLTIARNRVWQSPEALWREAVAGAPNEWLPRIQLAETLRVADRCNDAIPEYQRAMAFQPRETRAYEMQGACYLRLGRLNDASRTFARLSAMAPTSPNGPIGLALVTIARGGTADPRPQLRAALKRDPANITARQLFASYEERDNPGEALRWCQEIERLAPRTTGAAECVRRNSARLSGQVSP